MLKQNPQDYCQQNPFKNYPHLKELRLENYYVTFFFTQWVCLVKVTVAGTVAGTGDGAGDYKNRLFL